jgi:hypothetical protein
VYRSRPQGQRTLRDHMRPSRLGGFNSTFCSYCHSCRCAVGRFANRALFRPRTSNSRSKIEQHIISLSRPPSGTESGRNRLSFRRADAVLAVYAA